MDSVHLLTIVLFLVYAATGATSPMLSLYLESLGASYAHISMILTTHAVISMTASYGWGRLSDRLGRRKPMVVIGLSGLCLAFGLMAWVPSAEVAWGVWIVEALALAAYSTTSLAFLGDLLDTSAVRGRRMGAYRGFGSLSFALGAFGAGPVIDYLGMRTVFMIGACLFLVAALVAVTIREAKPTVPVRPDGETPLPVQRLPLVFLAGVLLWSCAFAAAYSMWPNFLISLGYPKSTANWLWGLAAISEVPMMTFVGFLADGIGRVPILVMGGFGMGLVIIGYITLNAWLAGLIGSQLFRGFAYSCFTATSMIVAVETGTNRSRAGTVGIYHVAMSLGQIIGLAAGGSIVQLAGFYTLFWLSTAIFICSGLMFGVLRWRQPAGQVLGNVQVKS
jgi:MFS family permease